MEVKISLDLYAYYEHRCPIYRVWVDDHLMNEREYWVDCLSNYIEEVLHLELEPGYHTLLVEKITVPQAKIWVEKAVIECGQSKEILSFGIRPQDKQTIKFLINIA